MHGRKQHVRRRPEWRRRRAQPGSARLVGGVPTLALLDRASENVTMTAAEACMHTGVTKYRLHVALVVQAQH